MGGEENALKFRSTPVTGLPPRGRGRGGSAVSDRRQWGITPAWAGKSRCRCPWRAGSRDYPRVGGEERPPGASWATARGLPPRGRGRVVSVTVGMVGLRITPAWAGKRLAQARRHPRREDYPRVGGEEKVDSDKDSSNLGLPPRGRGRGQVDGLGVLAERITPAWAGKRRGYRGARRHSRDYPRVGGEEDDQ